MDKPIEYKCRHCGSTDLQKVLQPPEFDFYTEYKCITCGKYSSPDDRCTAK